MVFLLVEKNDSNIFKPFSIRSSSDTLFLGEQVACKLVLEVHLHVWNSLPIPPRFEIATFRRQMLLWKYGRDTFTKISLYFIYISYLYSIYMCINNKYVVSYCKIYTYIHMICVFKCIIYANFTYEIRLSSRAFPGFIIIMDSLQMTSCETDSCLSIIPNLLGLTLRWENSSI